jgi:hypothetical protein
LCVLAYSRNTDARDWVTEENSEIPTKMERSIVSGQAFRSSIDADPDADPDSPYLPDAAADSDFYLMGIRIFI